MPLSALVLAAALQAAPVIGLEGSLPERPAFDGIKPVDQLVLPAPRKGRAWAARPASGTRKFSIGPSRGGATPYERPKRVFVINPQMVNCQQAPPERTRSSQTLNARPLSKMPGALGERAVARLVDGCPVAVRIAEGAAGR